MICITLDIDWAPDPVIADALELLDQRGIPATLFATHYSPVLKECEKDSRKWEIALHPNFNPLLEGKNSQNAKEIIDALYETYPGAVGVRSHSRTVSGGLIETFRGRGLLYDANQIAPYHAHLEPFNYCGFVRFTDFWQDDVHMVMQRPFILDDLPLHQPGLKIFAFHPVHIYLNTENPERYRAAKSAYQSPAELIAHRNHTNTPGTRDLFIELLEHLKTKSDSTGPLQLKQLAETTIT